MDKYVHVVRKVVLDTLTDEHVYLGQMHKYVKLSTSTDQFYLNFEVNKHFISKYQLLVYYITKEGETVATTKSDEIEPCSLKVCVDYCRYTLLVMDRSNLLRCYIKIIGLVIPSSCTYQEIFVQFITVNIIKHMRESGIDLVFLGKCKLEPKPIASRISGDA